MRRTFFRHIEKPKKQDPQPAGYQNNSNEKKALFHTKSILMNYQSINQHEISFPRAGGICIAVTRYHSIEREDITTFT
jgi:hypothetical protein